MSQSQASSAQIEKLRKQAEQQLNTGVEKGKDAIDQAKSSLHKMTAPAQSDDEIRQACATDMKSDDPFTNSNNLYDKFMNDLKTFVNCPNTDEEKLKCSFVKAERSYARVTAVERQVVYPKIKQLIDQGKLDKAYNLDYDLMIQAHETFDNNFQILGKYYQDGYTIKTKNFNEAMKCMQEHMTLHHKKEGTVWENIAKNISNEEKLKMKQEMEKVYCSVPQTPFSSYSSFSKLKDTFGGLFGGSK